jgi:hypothetical protein
MDIGIDGKDAGITLAAEKTLGDVLLGIYGYLEGAGFRVSALELEGAPAAGDEIAAQFDRPLAGIGLLNVKTRTAAEMSADALLRVLDALEAAPGGDAAGVLESPAMSYLRNEEEAVYALITAGLARGEAERLRTELAALAGERKRELENPCAELRAMAELVRAVCLRLADFALDSQTGKDARAAETVELCAACMRKFFRLLMLSRFYGTDIPAVVGGEGLAEFNSTLKEFLAAYENRDIVLSGDLAEYEVAPRFEELYQKVCAAAA